MEKKSGYNLLIVLVACIGSFTYGYIISVLAAALAQPTFYIYMGLDTVGAGKNYADSIIATWNCIMYVGAVIGGACYGTISNRFGRKTPISLGCIGVIIGGGLQAGCVDVAMLAVARVVIGLGAGLLLPAIPLYQAEVSPPHGRGFMVGLHGSALGFGNMFAQWVGVACFHAHGQVAWRIPLACLCIWPIFLVFLMFIMPESPRWLYTHGKAETAKALIIKLHKDKEDPTNSFALKEYAIMTAQLDLEAEKRISTFQALKIASIRRRFILGFLTMLGTQCSDLVVILTYSPIIYAGLGFTPFMSIVLTAAWAFFNGFGNFIGALVVDKAGRRRLMIGGYASVTCALIGATILTKLYAGTDTAGNRAAVFFIFSIICVYTVGIEAPSFVYASEIFPTELRAQGVAFSMQGLFLSTLLWTAVASPAFANIGWRFYIVFICTSTAMIFVVYFFFPETKGYTMEQLSSVFGDEVVDDTGHRQGEDDPTESSDEPEKVASSEQVEVAWGQ